MKFEGRGGGYLPRLIALLGYEVGPQHTSPLFVFVSLETSDSSAEWTADVLKCVCVSAQRSGHTKLVRKSFGSWGNTSLSLSLAHTQFLFPGCVIPFQETVVPSFIHASFDCFSSILFDDKSQIYCHKS